MIIVELVVSIICNFGSCVTHTITVSPEAAAIATCESGDTVTFGTVDWDAVGYNGTWSTDGGAWQFNSYWIWNPDLRWAIIPVANNRLGIHSDDFVERYPNAQSAPPYVQYEMFKYIWNNGYGWRNWEASRKCWSKWLTITEDGRAVYQLSAPKKRLTPQLSSNP